MLSVMWVAMYSSTASGICAGCDFGLLAQDGEPSLEVGRLDVGDEAGLEPGAESVLERRKVVGAAIARQHDLPSGLVERVERVEELLERLLSSLEELDVVDHAARRRPGNGA